MEWSLVGWAIWGFVVGVMATLVCIGWFGRREARLGTSEYTLTVASDRYVPQRLQVVAGCVCRHVMPVGELAWVHQADECAREPIDPRCTSCMLRPSSPRSFNDGRLRVTRQS